MPCKEVRTTGDVSQEAPGFGINPDLEPMYELKPRNYERIINEIVNLLIGTILRMHEKGQREGADSLGRSTARVLADYDDDVAEVIRLVTNNTTTF